LPLLLLLAISLTGLGISLDYKFMEGKAHQFMAITHAITVILFLLWMPFGKFYHIIQRPAQLGIAIYVVGHSPAAGGCGVSIFAATIVLADRHPGVAGIVPANSLRPFGFHLRQPPQLRGGDAASVAALGLHRDGLIRLALPFCERLVLSAPQFSDSLLTH